MNTTIETTPMIDEAQKKFDEMESNFQNTSKCQATIRAFFEKHRESAAPFHWRAYGWNDTEIIFDNYGQVPKDIARAFGDQGWKRFPDRWACGSIDWKKDLDGCTLIIKGAEKISPKLIDEVKL